MHASDQAPNRDEIWHRHIDEIKATVPWFKQLDAYDRYLHSCFTIIEENKELDEHQFFSERDFQIFCLTKLQEVTSNILKGEISPGVATKRTDLTRKLKKFGTFKLVEDNQVLYNAIKGIERKMNLNDIGMKLKLDETVKALKVGGDKSGLVNFFKNRAFDNLCLQHLAQEVMKTFSKAQIQEAVNKFLLLDGREVNANVEKEIQERQTRGETGVYDCEDVGFLEKVNGNYFLCHRCGAGYRKLHNAVLHSLICLARGKVTLTCLYCPHQIHGWDLSAYVYKRHIDLHIAELHTDMGSAGNREVFQPTPMMQRIEPRPQLPPRIAEHRVETPAVPNLFDVPVSRPPVSLASDPVNSGPRPEMVRPAHPPGPVPLLLGSPPAHAEQRPMLADHPPHVEHRLPGPPPHSEQRQILASPPPHQVQMPPFSAGLSIHTQPRPILAGPSGHIELRPIAGPPPHAEHRPPFSAGPPAHPQPRPLLASPSPQSEIPLHPDHRPLLAGPTPHTEHRPSFPGPQPHPEHRPILAGGPPHVEHRPPGPPPHVDHRPLLAGPPPHAELRPSFPGAPAHADHRAMLPGPPSHAELRPPLPGPPSGPPGHPHVQPLLGSPPTNTNHGPEIVPLLGDTRMRTPTRGRIQ